MFDYVFDNKWLLCVYICCFSIHNSLTSENLKLVKVLLLNGYSILVSHKAAVNMDSSSSSAKNVLHLLTYLLHGAESFLRS